MGNIDNKNVNTMLQFYDQAVSHFKEAIDCLIERSKYKTEILLAKKNIDKEIHEMKKDSSLNFVIGKTVYFLAGKIYSHFDEKKSLEFFKLFQFYIFNNWITDISNKADKEKKYFNNKRYEGVTAYRFRACSPYLFADLTNDTITLCRPHCVNDPFDSLYSIWSEEDNLANVIKDKTHIPMFKKSFDYYRFCCFCIDKNAKNTILRNILMWSHYADEHKGICIKYKLKGNCINSDCSDDVPHPQALLHRIDYKNVGPVSVQDKSIKTGLAFAHKYSCWKYEKEARIIQYDSTKEDDRLTISYDEGISIEAIYFGLNCSKDNKAIIKKLLADKNIEYYDMKPNYGDIYKMDIKKLF